MGLSNPWLWKLHLFGNQMNAWIVHIEQHGRSNVLPIGVNESRTHNTTKTSNVVSTHAQNAGRSQNCLDELLEKCIKFLHAKQKCCRKTQVKTTIVLSTTSHCEMGQLPMPLLKDNIAKSSLQTKKCHCKMMQRKIKAMSALFIEQFDKSELTQMRTTHLVSIVTVGPCTGPQNSTSKLLGKVWASTKRQLCCTLKSQVVCKVVWMKANENWNWRAQIGFTTAICGKQRKSGKQRRHEKHSNSGLQVCLLPNVDWNLQWDLRQCLVIVVCFLMMMPSNRKTKFWQRSISCETSSWD